LSDRPELREIAYDSSSPVVLRERSDTRATRLLVGGIFFVILSYICSSQPFESIEYLNRLHVPLWIESLASESMAPFAISGLSLLGISYLHFNSIPSYLLFDSKGVYQKKWGTLSVIYWGSIERIQIVGTGRNRRIIYWTSHGFMGQRYSDFPGSITLAKLRRYCSKSGMELGEARVRKALIIFARGTYISTDSLDP
jgi:hypothetical protein